MKYKFFKIFILSFACISFLWIPYIFPYFSNVDEPGYLASAMQLARGKLLYKDVFEAKGPGMMYIFKIFVKLSPTNFTLFIHLFMFLLLFLNSFLIYKILTKKINYNFALLGFFFPIFLSCFYPLDMITGPEFFVCPIILASYVLFIYFPHNIFSIFIMGLFSGLILLFKPFGIFYVFCFFLLIILKTKKFKNFLFYFSGIFIPIILFFYYLVSNNLLNEFYLWTIEYPIFVSKTIPLYRKIYYFFPMVGRLMFLNPFYIIFGLPLIFNKEIFKENFDTITLFFVSLLWGASHGLPFPHHYMVAIPFIFMLSIIGFCKFNKNFLNNKEIKKIIELLIIFSLLQSLIYWNGFDFYKKWIEFIKEKKWTKEYEEKKYKEILDFLKENVKRDDKIIIWGLNPKIYVLSDISPGTKFISSVEPINGIVYYDVSKIIQFKKAEKIFINEIQKKEVKFFIDATFNSLIGIPYYTIDKYPEIKKVIDIEYKLFPLTYSGCKIYKQLVKKE
ncbi:MAG: glycosyltransferase family 39 protein [bacterium]|nr:glycosyltransferase family 39 protein [bacterium]